MSIIKLARKPKLILFDLDDTLVNSTEIYGLCYQQLGLNLEVLTKAKNQIKKSLGAGHVSSHQRLLYFKNYLEAEQKFSAETLLELIDKYEALLAKEIRSSWEILNRDSLMRKLKRHFNLAIITNENTRTQIVKLNALDSQMQYFDFIVTSEEVGVEKPDFKIFHECQRRSQLEFSDILMIGDSIENDLIPAKKLGAQVLGSNEFAKDRIADSDFIWIKNLNELESIL